MAPIKGQQCTTVDIVPVGLTNLVKNKLSYPGFEMLWSSRDVIVIYLPIILYSLFMQSENVQLYKNKKKSIVWKSQCTNVSLDENLVKRVLFGLEYTTPSLVYISDDSGAVL